MGFQVGAASVTAYWKSKKKANDWKDPGDLPRVVIGGFQVQARGPRPGLRAPNCGCTSIS